MDFTGDEGVQAIVTFGGTCVAKDGCNESNAKQLLLKMLEISQEHIAMFGKDTLCNDIENHLVLHVPSPSI